jgi:hypothetical protein
LRCQLKRGCLLDWDVGDIAAAKEFDDLLGHYFCIDLTNARPVSGKATFLSRFWNVRRADPGRSPSGRAPNSSPRSDEPTSLYFREE